MKELFAAIREKHPGFEVMDVRFLTNPREVRGQSADQLDSGLAQAVRDAKYLPLEALT